MRNAGLLTKGIMNLMKSRRRRLSAMLLLSTTALAAAALLPHATPALASKKAAKKHLLVVTVTTGFPHDSRPTAERVITELGQQTGEWDTDIASADNNLSVEQKAEILKAKMTPEAMQKYDAIVFANTTGVLPLPDDTAFMNYIRAGHGFVAMHSGGDTFHQWPPTPNEPISEYVKMLGAEFLGHHSQCQIAPAISDPGFPANKRLLRAAKKMESTPAKTSGDARQGIYLSGNQLNVFDEIYLFKNVDRSNIHVLLSLDKHPNDGSPEANQPGEYLVSWTKSYGKGRVFYTSLGHRIEVWKDPLYQAYITGGIEFALGLAKGSTAPTPMTVATH